MATELTIGKLADAAGVNVETIRYYQRRGLLDEPAKPWRPSALSGGHGEATAFHQAGSGAGFHASEVGGLLTLDESCVCAETRASGCTQARVDRAEDGRLGRQRSNC